MKSEETVLSTVRVNTVSDWVEFVPYNDPKNTEYINSKGERCFIEPTDDGQIRALKIVGGFNTM